MQILYHWSLIVRVQTFGWSALFFAIEEGNTEITQVLVQSGAKLDIKDKVREETSRLTDSLRVSLHFVIFFCLLRVE